MNNDRKFALCAASVFLLLTGFSSALTAQTQGSKPPFTPGTYPHRNAPSGAPAARPPSPSPFVAPSTAAEDKKTPAGESFFMIASVDQSKSQVLLKRPTEVTLLVSVNANTKYLDDSGQPLKVSDFRAGDTVWVTTSGGGDQPAATRIRKGQLTVADLHHYYLDYPEIK
jgi:hypothetical protein